MSTSLAFRPLALMTAALILLPGGVLAQAGDAFSGIPNVRFQYYDVAGTSPQAIRASINAGRPSDTNDGKPVDALTRWHYNWTFRMGADGCHGTVFFSTDAILPRLADPQNVPANVLADWRLYLANLFLHESVHARFAYEHRDDIQKALEGPSCANANASANAVLAVIRQHDVDYDRQTDHGKNQGARFP